MQHELKETYERTDISTILGLLHFTNCQALFIKTLQEVQTFIFENVRDFASFFLVQEVAVEVGGFTH